MNCAPGVHLLWSDQPHRAVGKRAPHPPVLLGVYRGGEDCREERLGHEPWLPNDQLWLRLLRALPSLLLQQLQLQRSCGSFTADGIQCSVANGTVHDPPGFEGTLSTFDQEEFFDGDAEAMSMATIDQQGFVYVPPQCGDGRLAGSSSGHLQGQDDHLKDQVGHLQGQDDHLQDQDGSLTKCHLHFNFHGCTTRASFVWSRLHQAHWTSPSSRCLQRCYCVPTNCAKFCQPPWLLGLVGVPGDSKDHAHATKNVLQMKGVAAMVQRVSGIVL